MNNIAPQAAAPSSPPRRRRRWPWWVAGIIIGLPLLLVACALLWIGSSSSLRQALDLAARFLPQDQSLEYRDVSGSITRGGSIGHLQWSGVGITLTVEDFTLDWALRDLLDHALQVKVLRAGRIHVLLGERPEPEPTEPFVMPDEVTLPFRASVPVEIGRLEIELAGAPPTDADSAAATGTTTYAFDDIRAQYVYDDVRHTLRLESLGYGDSHLQAGASLHARELTLDAQLAASLRDPAPEVPLAMLLHADARGTLGGGEAARIDVQVDAREQPRDAPVPEAAQLLESLADLRTTLEDDPGAESTLAQLYLRGSLHPWRAQPVESLDLRANRLNAGAFHPAAPVTLLAGDAQVRPVADAEESWNFTLALRNGAAGPWDSQRLPVRAVNAQAQLTPEGLDIEAAQVRLAGEDDAGIQLTGNLPREGLSQARLQLQLQQVDLRPLMTALPVTRFDGSVDLTPLPGGADEGWQAVADVRNALAGRLDEERLPMDQFAGTLRATPDSFVADALRLVIGEGDVLINASYAPDGGALDVRGELRRLPLADIHGQLARGAASSVSGTLTVAGALEQQLVFDADINSDRAGATSARSEAPADRWDIRRLQLQGSWSPTHLRVSRVDIDALGARIEGSGIDVALPEFASVAAHVNAVAPGLTLDADASMQQRSGGGTLSMQLASAEEMFQWLGELPLIGEQLPAMQAAGAASLEATWQGGWQQWMDGLRRPERYPDLAVDARLVSEQLRIDMGSEDAAVIELDNVNASLAGNFAEASLAMAGAARMADRAATLDVQVRMQHDPADAAIPGWQLQFERMVVDATLPEHADPWRLALADGLVVNLSTGDQLQVQSTAGELSLAAPGTTEPLRLAWEPLQLRRSSDGATQLDSRGTIQGIQPAWLDVFKDEFGAGRLQAAGLGTDLALSAEWDFSLAETLEVHARLQRDQGDVWLLGEELLSGGRARPVDPADRITAGIRVINLAVDSVGDEVAVTLNWETQRAGVVEARAATRFTQSGDGWSIDEDAPVDGHLTARLQDLAMWGIFTPPGWRIQGEIDADLAIAGSVSEPQVSGPINGRRINVRSVLDGVELHDGVLRASVSGQQLTISELMFQGGTGSRAYISGMSGNRTQAPTARGRMTATGLIDWSGVQTAGPNESGIEMDFSAKLERMQVLVRNDRQLTLSGDLSAALNQGALRVRGDLNVDRASIRLPDAGAPTLGDDVVIVRNTDELELVEVGTVAANGSLESSQPMDVEIRLNLGRDLALDGYGITTRLEGELTVRSSPLPNQPFSVFGEVRTDEGRYRAWGQALNVETGEVAFNGSYENPALNLLAIRPDIDVRAGVRVTGTLRAPQVELYSDPPLPEAERLSWVVLGRPMAISGGEGTSVQRAALSLLAGQAVSGLADNLGVDELGLGDSGVSVGKRISDKLYLTYEAGLSGAASTLYIFYDITRRFTVRGESGEANAIDLIYSFDFD